MAIRIDADLRMFADRLNITSSRMQQDYGQSTIDEIIKAEAAQGNTQAVLHAKDYYNSPDKLIEIFQLADVENKFVLINEMDDETRKKLLPFLENEDLVMGLYFFTKDKLLEMLMEVDIEELVQVILEAFPFDEIIKMFTEEDLMKFFLNEDLPKEDVVKQIKMLPPEVMQKFIEGVTGQPAQETDPAEFIQSIERLPDDKFAKFMSAIDPDVQRQLVFQLTKEKPDYLALFPNESYVNMLATLKKPDMVKPMVKLSQETLINMNTMLPPELLSIVASQIDTKEFAKYLQAGHMDLLEKAWLK